MLCFSNLFIYVKYNIFVIYKSIKPDFLRTLILILHWVPGNENKQQKPFIKSIKPLFRKIWSTTWKPKISIVPSYHRKSGDIETHLQQVIDDATRLHRWAWRRCIWSSRVSAASPGTHETDRTVSCRKSHSKRWKIHHTQQPPEPFGSRCNLST